MIRQIPAIILHPKAAAEKLLSDGPSVRLILRYCLVVAFIPGICGIFGRAVVGRELSRVVLRDDALQTVLRQGAIYVMAFLALWLTALCFRLIWRRFGVAREFSTALLFAALSYTPLWLTGVFSVQPVMAETGLAAGFLISLGLIFQIVPTVGSFTGGGAKKVAVFSCLSFAVCYGSVAALAHVLGNLLCYRLS